MCGELATDHRIAGRTLEALLMHRLALDSNVSLHLVADNTPRGKLLLVAVRVIVRLLPCLCAIAAINNSAACCAPKALPVHRLALHTDVSVHLVAGYAPCTKLLLVAGRMVWQVVLRACDERTLQDSRASCTSPAVLMPVATKRSERSPRDCFAAPFASSLIGGLHSCSSSCSQGGLSWAESPHWASCSKGLLALWCSS